MSDYNHISFFIFLGCISLFLSCTDGKKKGKEDWQPLFNGKNMEGWTPKFRGFPLGENYKNTFRVTDGILQASYSEYDDFKGEFGHLFHKDKFSYYKIRTEYRMVGEQVKNGPGWAYANNGLMLHSQSPESMSLDQSFPLSIEYQLLGGNGTDERQTGNLCTPGCHVTLNGEVFTPHCVNSTSKTYHGHKWVTAEAVVLGDSIVHHIIEGDTVMTYTKPVIGGGLDGLDSQVFKEGTPMTEGYIAIQAESHGTDFRKIEVLDLCGCMDENAKNYKSYYVKSKPSSCIY